MPEGVKNEASWISSCCRISARARDLLEGRLGLFETSSAMNRLAMAIQVERYEDQDFRVFALIHDDLCDLPVGPERAHWDKDALLREDKKIAAIEERSRTDALAAARNLVERYAWAYERRAELRRVGHVFKDD